MEAASQRTKECEFLFSVAPERDKRGIFFGAEGRVKKKKFKKSTVCFLAHIFYTADWKLIATAWWISAET